MISAFIQQIHVRAVPARSWLTRTVHARKRAEREPEQYDQASMYTYWQESSNHNSIPTNQDKGQHLPRSAPSIPKVGDLQKLNGQPHSSTLDLTKWEK
jgi:hypothetical protein